MDENAVFGFNENDADALIRIIGDRGEEVREFIRPRARQAGGGIDIVLAVLGSGGFVAGEAVDSFLYDIDGPDYTATGVSTTIYDPPRVFASLPGNTLVWVFEKADKYYILQAACPIV